MRITADQKIAGYPAVQIRQLMRETVGRSITLRYVREILRCSDAAATRVLNRLRKDGFVEPARGHLEPTTKGSALAMATADAVFGAGCERARPGGSGSASGNKPFKGAQEEPRAPSDIGGHSEPDSGLIGNTLPRKEPPSSTFGRSFDAGRRSG
jgi:hypothetical protein